MGSLYVVVIDIITLRAAFCRPRPRLPSAPRISCTTRVSLARHTPLALADARTSLHRSLEGGWDDIWIHSIPCARYHSSSTTHSFKTVIVLTRAPLL